MDCGSTKNGDLYLRPEETDRPADQFVRSEFSVNVFKNVSCTNADKRGAAP